MINRRSRIKVPNRLLLFKTVFRPRFSYGTPVFAGCAYTHKRLLQIHQNPFLKMMLDKPRRFATARLHELDGVELVEDYLLRLRDSFIASCETNVNRDVVDLINQ